MVNLFRENSYTTLIDETASGTYFGKAVYNTATGTGAWQLRFISKTGNVTSVLYPSGDDRYIFVWDNRAIYTYS